MTFPKRFTSFLPLLFLLWTLTLAQPAYAHANLSRSEPAANTSLTTAPPEIRIWFTEPVEPSFSRIEVLTVEGEKIDLPPSQVDANDSNQLYLTLGALPDGLYTVAWRVVSSADGHATKGSFAFGINFAVTGVTDSAPVVNETVVPEHVAVRWFALMSYALALGSIGFRLFVWRPSGGDNGAVERRLTRLAWIGWVALGLALSLSLLLQASLAGGADSIFSGETLSAVGGLLGSTTYGLLWLIRAGLWLLLGGLLRISPRDGRGLWLALLVGAGILLAHALFSHAAATPDSASAVAADWLHLLATALWVGGLIAFVITLPLVRRLTPIPAPLTGRLVGYFSNMARTGVAALVVTGIYATWIQVGSVEALLGTVYGRALIVKLALFLPLLATAGLNLLITQRRLNAGDVIWVGRLRALVAGEVVLACAALIAAGVLTSGAPSRNVQAVLDAEPIGQPDPSYFQMSVVNDQMMHFEIRPGYVGENTFIVNPFTADGDLITDASLIRLRFTNLDQNLGQSELRIEPEGVVESGLYEVRGNNLSAVGRWRVRMTIQRPSEFDVVTDFEIDAKLPPPPPQRVVEIVIPGRQRMINGLAAGLALIGLGFFFAAPGDVKKGGGGWWPFSGERLIAVGALVVGLVFVANAGLTYLEINQPETPLVAHNAYANPALLGSTGGVYVTLENTSRRDERLIGGFTEVAQTVELHRTGIENDIGRMERLNSLDIPVGETIPFEERGEHLMLVGLHQDLRPGDTFTITLNFASGKTLPITVTVR